MDLTAISINALAWRRKATARGQLCVQGLREQLDIERRVARSRQSGEQKEYDDKVSRLQVQFRLPNEYVCAATQLVMQRLGCQISSQYLTIKNSICTPNCCLETVNGNCLQRLSLLFI